MVKSGRLFQFLSNRFSGLIRCGGILLLLATAVESTNAGTNLLSDPGFESVPGGKETNVVAGWTTYGQGFNTLAETAAAIAHSGSNYFKLFQGFTGSVNYSGVYQDLPATADTVFSGDGWIRTSLGDKLAGGNIAWIEVTFRDTNANILALYRTTQIDTNVIATAGLPVDTWVHFGITNEYDPNQFTFLNTVANLVAPVGTSFVRYQIVLQGDAANSNGSLFFDDLNLVQTQGNIFSNAPSGTAWNIVWNDEFNGTNVDSKHWQFETGNGQGGWGNNELEYYTGRTNNASVSGGLLHITARKESFAGFNYTSARMKTEGLFAKKYGRFEWRAKLPQGQGFWPALWMMPEDSVYGGWAASGEIDVMENQGFNNAIFGTIHYGGPFPNQQQSFGPQYDLGSDAFTAFHTYEVDWESNAISWYVDGHLYETQTSWYSASDPANQNNHNPYPAPFDQPFYIIMNVAVGGNFVSNPATNTVFPSELQVDYVRVYDLTAPLQISAAETKTGVRLTWPSNIVCHLQAQTNINGLGSHWVDLTNASPPFVPPAAGNRAVFYRLASP